MQRVTRVLLRILPEVALVVVALLFIAVRLNASVPGATPAERCGIDPAALAAPAPPGAIELEVWAPAAHRNCWLAFAPWLAAQQVTEYPIHVEVNAVNAAYETYLPELQAALHAGAAPDVFFVNGNELIAMAEQGDLAPLDACIARYPIFRTVYDDLWQTATQDGHTWGVPISISVNVLYFSKDKLRALGWSDAQIAALPKRIAARDFTIEDLLATADQAVRDGVVAPGHGFWPSLRPQDTLLLRYYSSGGRSSTLDQSKLLIQRKPLVETYQFHRDLRTNRLMPDGLSGRTDFYSFPTNTVIHDAVANGSTLFWQESGPRWRIYDEIHDQTDDTTLLSDKIGVAQFPVARRDIPGYVVATGHNYYALPAPHLGSNLHQDAACALLAELVTPEINALNAREQTMLGVLKSQALHPAFATDPFTVAVAEMWQQPIHLPFGDPDFRITYRGTLVDWLLRVENGAYTPEEAATLAIQELQAKLGDKLIVEE